MYLDGGQVPARYQIQRYKLNFLQYILHQDENSILYTMLEAQRNHPVRGDWFSECEEIRKCFNIDISIEDIKIMTRKQFRKITKQKSEETAFKQLIIKKEKGSKGSTLKYGKGLEMAEYLCPNNQLSVEDQRQIFQIRSQINPLASNRGETSICVTGCGEILENSHILKCKVLNNGEENSLQELINGDIHSIRNSLIKWKQSMKIIEELSTLDPT